MDHMISPLPLRSHFPISSLPQLKLNDLRSADHSSSLKTGIPWTEAGMYEPLYFPFDAYPSVVPRVRVRGVMALFLAASILWALIW